MSSFEFYNLRNASESIKEKRLNDDSNLKSNKFSFNFKDKYYFNFLCQKEKKNFFLFFILFRMRDYI